MKKIKLILVALVPLVFQACVTNKNLSSDEVLNKAIGGCPNHQMTLITLPSRGAIADAMAISAIKAAGNDGGFSEDFSRVISSEPKNITVYCSNPQKLEATISHTFTLYKENSLKGVSVCIVGMSKNKELTDEARRTGAAITFVP